VCYTSYSTDDVTHTISEKKTYVSNYGVATNCRLLTNISLFGEYRSLLKGSFANETCNFKEPANRSHAIEIICVKIDDHIQFSVATRVVN